METENEKDIQMPIKKFKTSDGETAVDRLSNLPESVIHVILSLIDAKQAVQTSVLSKKWKFRWAHTPSYALESFSPEFFVSLLRYRKLFNLTKPTFCVNGNITMMSLLVEVFYPYILSCKIEELEVTNKVQLNGHMLVDRLSSLPDSVIHHILSLMDTKYAVQTSVLSTKWKDLWTYVHTLNFNRSSFDTWVDFKEFVVNVLKHRKPLPILKLKLICGDTVRVRFAERVLEYAKSHGVQEIDTDVIGELHRYYAVRSASPCKSKSIKTLRIEKALRNLSMDHLWGFETMTTLQVSCDLPEHVEVFSFDEHSNLKNLRLIDCVLSSVADPVYCCLYASNLVTLTVSDFEFCQDLSIYVPTLKFFNWSGDYPCTLSFDKCSELEEVNIHFSDSPDFERDETWFMDMRSMVAKCPPAKFITVSLDVSEVKFILSYSSINADINVVEFNQKKRVKRLLYISPMVSGFDPNQFAVIFDEILGGKKSLTCDTMEVDRLSCLPDDIVHHILSFLDAKCAVQTSILSKIWRYRWTHVRSLNLECLVKLTISKFKCLEKSSKGKLFRADPTDVKIVIKAPRLVEFELIEVHPLLLSMDDCPTLEKVDIHVENDKEQAFILDIFHMVKELFHVNHFRMALNFTKERFVLCHNRADEEAKIAVLNKDTGVKQLVGSAMIRETI